MLYIFDKLIILLGIVAIVAMIFFLFFALRIWFYRITERHSMNSTKKRSNVPLIVSVFMVAGPIVLSLVLSLTMAGLSSQEVRSFLYKLDKNYTISIEGKIIEHPELYLAELKKISMIPTHHSHPINNIKIEISDKNSVLQLFVGRDSQKEDVYWVFYPKYRNTKMNPIGKIRTNIF